MYQQCIQLVEEFQQNFKVGKHQENKKVLKDIEEIYKNKLSESEQFDFQMYLESKVTEAKRIPKNEIGKRWEAEVKKYIKAGAIFSSLLALLLASNPVTLANMLFALFAGGVLGAGAGGAMHESMLLAHAESSKNFDEKSISTVRADQNKSSAIFTVLALLALFATANATPTTVVASSIYGFFVAPLRAKSVNAMAFEAFLKKQWADEQKPFQKILELIGILDNQIHHQRRAY